MKLKELTYTRTFNLGNFENEKISLKIELEPTDYLDETFKRLKETVERLHITGGK